MIRITIYKDRSSNDITGFKSEGHAGYSTSGKDIVCAAVSVLVINTINAIEQFTEEVDFECTSDEKNAIIKFMVTANQTKESLVLLKAFELGVSQIAIDNPRYISITFEEV